MNPLQRQINNINPGQINGIYPQDTQPVIKIAERIVRDHSNDIVTKITGEDGISSKMINDSFFRTNDLLSIKSSEMLRGEIAKYIARCEWGCNIRMSNVSVNIEKYQLTDIQLLKEIALIEAEKSGYNLAAWIHKYALPLQDRIEVAKVLARHWPGELACHMEKFQIEDANILNDLLIISCDHCKYTNIKYIVEKITNFNIRTDEEKASCFKYIIEKKGFDVLEYFNKFKINSDAIRTELLIYTLEISDERKDASVWCKLDRFDITDKSIKLNLAISFIKGFNVNSIIYSLKKIDLKDHINLKHLGRMIVFYSLIDPKNDGNICTFENECAKIKGLENQVRLAKALIGDKEFDQNDKDELLLIFKAYLDPELFNKFDVLFTSVLNYSNARFCLMLCKVLKTIDEQTITFLLQHPIPFEIAQLREPKLREDLLRRWAKFISDGDCVETFKKTINNPKKDKKINPKFNNDIFHMYYALLINLGIDSHVLDIVMHWARKNYFKDQTKQRALLHVLESIYALSARHHRQSLYFSPECNPKVVTETLLKMIFPNEKKRGRGQTKEEMTEWGPVPADIYKEASAIISLANCKLLDSYFLNPILTPSAELNSQFPKIVPLNGIEDLPKKLPKKIFSSRNPEAFFHYAASLQNLEDRENCLKAYGTYLSWLLDGVYEDERYNLEQHSHLKEIFDNRQNLLEDWKKGKKAENLTAFIPNFVSTNQHYSCYDYLYDRIITYRHIDQKDFPLISQYLADPSNMKVGNADSIEGWLIQLSQIAIGGENREVSEEKAILAAKLIDQLLIEEIPDVFKNDLIGMKKQLSNLWKKVSSEKFSIADTDDPVDMLLCGTEVSGSCQHVQQAGYNRALNAYLIDGKIRMIAIKNKGVGTIVARSIFRILQITETMEPVLMLEKVYQGGANDLFDQAILEFAKIRAKELQLPLVGTVCHGEAFPFEIKSPGSNAPWEYVDSLNGAKPNGNYMYKASSLKSLL